MGITDFSVSLLELVIREYHPQSICELGDQILYTSDGRYGKYADVFYSDKGVVQYMCLDLNGGNGAIKYDLSEDIRKHYTMNSMPQFDLVTDFGVSEHIGKEGHFDWEAIYNCWLNKHNFMRWTGGIMVNENPLTGHWKGHGFQWYCQEFYEELVKISDYKLVDTGIICAMGNCQDGQNVWCVLQKQGNKFPSLKEFKTLPLKQS